jgi:NADPH:quinone reductase-like Zn-dependent oxidoreductase
MNAAVVTAFDQPPHYQDFPLPDPTDPDELVVDVLAAGLHPRVRSQADGSHYTSTDDLPLVPGIDGVGRGADGVVRYFVLPDTRLGSFAQRTVIDRRRSVALPATADPVAVAAIMNPAMSSWVALRRRIDFQPGQRVLILGATGNAGRMAIQVARRLGAAEVFAAARDTARLAKLRDCTTLPLSDLARAADVDVVPDYGWGDATTTALASVITGRADRAKPLTWIEIGSVGGADARIPSAALRAARLQVVGSGQGSVPTRDIVGELPALADEIARGTFTVDATPVPLADVTAAWTRPATDARIVVVP